MDDLISRRKAIDALGDMVMNWTDSDYELGQLNQWKADRKAIIDLPSAQPEKTQLSGESTTKDSTFDCISRQAAIRWVKTECNPYGKPTLEFESGKRVIEYLKQMPSAQPEQRWIPCSERLPEEDTEVLISYRYKEGEGDTDHVNIDITSYGTTCFGGREIHTLKEWRQPFDYFHANYEVIAWMPLPEPYKEEKHETD